MFFFLSFFLSFHLTLLSQNVAYPGYSPQCILVTFEPRVLGPQNFMSLLPVWSGPSTKILVKKVRLLQPQSAFNHLLIDWDACVKGRPVWVNDQPMIDFWPIRIIYVYSSVFKHITMVITRVLKTQKSWPKCTFRSKNGSKIKMSENRPKWPL